MAYEIQLTNDARKDLRHLYEYIESEFSTTKAQESIQQLINS